MIFPSEKKKELWRYASRNNPATCDADGIPIPTQQQQPPLPPHQRRLQTCATCFCIEQSSAMRQLNSPPPPYSSIPASIDCSGSYRQVHCQHKPAQDQQQQTSYHMATEESDYSYIKDGCTYVSSGEDMLIDENGPCPMLVPMPAAYSNAHSTTSATTFAMSAANMFRNCCGGGQTTDSSSGEFAKTNPPDNRRHILSRSRTSISTPTCPMHPHAPAFSTAGAIVSTTAICHRTPNQIFNALLKKLKNKQIGELLQAVKSRVDPPPKCNPMAANGAVIATVPSYLQCILIKCTSSFDEEQHVTTCQLFFWSDLRGAGELKRLPTCPSALDYVYICCNPLHWYRILNPIDSESAPPPYQRSKMLRLRDIDSEGNTQNNERSSTAAAWANSNSSRHSQSISSIIKQAESQLYAPSFESFTTDGKDHNVCPRAWCQIAYWELAQRVGDLFHAKKSTVNVYADGPVDSAGESMCLRELGGKRTALDAVQNTRQKVGLGVTLSLECGDVWIYNRSYVPIFVDSPTLAERLDRVCKVMPGYCLKAFETTKAQWLACKQTHQNHLGPVDRFSLKISFAKGWGNTYRRQDVMGCPCWMEVHFSHLR